MTTRTRSQALADDLLHDIADVPAAPVVQPTRAPTPVRPTAFAQISLFLAPQTWLRPRIARHGATVSLSAGPVQLRLGRG